MADLFHLNDIERRLSENALKVLEKRYLTKDPEGKVIETVDGLFRRVARAIAAPESHFAGSTWRREDLEEAFYRMMTDLDFLPNSPTLMNAGKPLGQLAACFVLPVPDTLEGIFEAIKQAALIHKSGGGTGFSFSRLRPANDLVASTSGVSSGPVSFMKVFNTATETIKQGGTRRGANMGILRVDHPDILEFITAKEDDETLTNFNLSVGITDEFMETLDRDGEYDLINPRTGKAVKSLKASKVFNMIVERAWRNGEPGIVFLDRINRDQPTPHVGMIESTNPCGEQPLLPFESCNLGSLNLARFIRREGDSAQVDYDRLREVVHLAVRFLDNVIEVNKYPFPEIEEMTKANRKIGLGVMGWADLLIALHIPYNSEAALTLAEELMRFIRREAWEASTQLGRERGAFPNFPGSALQRRGMPPVRNATVTTIAPTGTISLIAGCSSGIEPLFAIAFAKNVLDKERLFEVNPQFVEIAKAKGFYSKELIEKVAAQGHLKNLPGIPDWVRKIFVTSHEISPEWHVRMQAAFQKNTDNAVSKTVNFPHEATIKDVEVVFRLAHTLGCKGITVYRDGSRQAQVLTAGAGTPAKSAPSTVPPRIVPRPRPTRTTGVTERTPIGCGNLYVTVNSDEQGICEVFTSLGRAGGCPSQSEATARLASMALRAGIDVQEIIDQLKGIRCLSTLKRSGPNGRKVLSCPDAIGRAIEQVYLQRKAPTPGSTPEGVPPAETASLGEGQSIPCPECQAPLTHDGGCVMCRACGYSRCG
ncbi:MAG: Ribonucleotide reductase of class II (coenzyme B12-dependent) [Candidatus Ozemobacter sibiricus]|uniref:Vitamin B12-dependent ribonucleotide reductase n=1 Tax=Candidatus Ozemobacter sibiricus TaxID=2268124 RepID=A0A367ZII5_9BACT|nr:MAG: Ribonucleotide reductase of class II (coenzyme B12-dependent) [Candidatus Ozemobacter sibiricus]